MAADTNASLMDCEDSASSSGYAMKLFGDLVSWRSHKQTIVTRSSCESEYFALSEVYQEIISQDKALGWILVKTAYPVPIYCDNESALLWTTKEGSHKLKGFDDDYEIIVKDLKRLRGYW